MAKYIFLLLFSPIPNLLMQNRYRTFQNERKIKKKKKFLKQDLRKRYQLSGRIKNRLEVEDECSRLRLTKSLAVRVLPLGSSSPINNQRRLHHGGRLNESLCFLSTSNTVSSDSPTLLRSPDPCRIIVI